LADILIDDRSVLEKRVFAMKIPQQGDTKAIMQNIFVNHILSLVRDREKVPVRRNFIAVIRQGGFKVVRPRGLKCCDIVIFETALSPDDSVDPRIVEKCVTNYINWELKLYFK